jgi:hypothetical protein
MVDGGDDLSSSWRCVLVEGVVRKEIEKREGGKKTAKK